MKIIPTSFSSTKIGTQIAILVVGALALAHVAITAGFFILGPGLPEQNGRFGAVERLIFVARMLNAETSRDVRATLFAEARRADSGLFMLQSPLPPETSAPDVRMMRDLQARFGASPELFVVRLPTEERMAAARLLDGKLLVTALPTSARHI